MADIKLGVLCWNQYTDWQSLLEAGIRVDELGFHSLWTWDHLYPIVGDHTGPMFEGWLTLAAWAQATRQVRIGLMVGANTFREPPLVAKMATTLDHISNGRAVLGNGRAVLGIGAACSRPSIEPSVSSTATGHRSDCGGSARRSPSCAGCSPVNALRPPATATTPAGSSTTRRPPSHGSRS